MAASRRFSVFFLLIIACSAQNPPDSTPAPPTTPPPTTTPTTAPSTVPPTAPPTTFEANTDLAVCTCDLTALGCDVECCCDPDCSPEDVQVFSKCMDEYTPGDDRACVRRSIIFMENVPMETNEATSDLFCVYTDNNQERSYYRLPDLVDTQQSFDEISQRYGSYSFSGQASDTSTDLPRTFYKSGDPIYTVYDSLALGRLGLPKAFVNDECVDTNPAAYLVNQQNECVRRVSNLAAECQTNPVLNANTYFQGFRVVALPFPNPLNSVVENEDVVGAVPTENETMPVTTESPSVTTSAPIPVTLVYPTLEDLYNNNNTMLRVVPKPPHTCQGQDGLNNTCDFETVIPSPTYTFDAQNNINFCNNVVTKVEYLLSQHGETGLTEVGIRFSLASITAANVPLTQAFSTKFAFEGSQPGFERSGNPGYQLDEPILAGQLITRTDPDGQPLAVQLDGSRSNWLTMVTSTVHGDCLTQPNNRVPVRFGENMRSGCNLRVSLSNLTQYCTMLQEAAKLALTGPDPPTHVATFGNINVETVGDWIEILSENAPTTGATASSTQPGVCINIVLGMHIEILYANVGAQANPQPKIIGAAFRYDPPQDIRFQCVGPYCHPGTEDTLTQTFQVSSSVGFVDVTEPAIGVVGESPKLWAKLPQDFFFPFA